MMDIQNGVNPQSLVHQILQTTKEVQAEQAEDKSVNHLDDVHDTKPENSTQTSVRPRIKAWIENNGKPEFVPKHVRDSCLAVKQTLDASTGDAVKAIECALKKFQCKDNRTVVPNILMYIVFIMLVWLLIFFGITIAYNTVLIHNAKLMQVIWFISIGIVGSISVALAMHYKIYK